MADESGGGGLSLISCPVVSIYSTSVVNNSAGGGMHFEDCSKVTLDTVTVTDNEGASCAGMGLILGNVSITSSLIAQNTATGSNGGGVCTSSVSSFNVYSSFFVGNNAAQSGGAIYATTTPSMPSAITIKNTTFSRNTAMSGGGGGLYLNATISLSTSSSVLSDNSATGGHGGALAAWAFNSINMDNVTMTRNTASYGLANSKSKGLGGGGAIALLFANTFYLTDSTITGNKVLDGGIGGGGISAAQQNVMYLIRSTFSHNVVGGGVGGVGGSGGSGGAIFSDLQQNITMQDCTFAYNEALLGNGGAVVVGSYDNLPFCFQLLLRGQRRQGRVMWSPSRVDSDGR
jgi:predicted outer membrane repeat protein